ncbi:MAG: CopG family transcriptional regulator [Anaerolineales bacterium]|nr:CopG family transcriptional regulator [Anaerolineales bacterium]
MSTQMIIRIDDELKNKFDRLARQEGKSVSQVVRELVEQYVTSRDMSAHIDELWDRIGTSLISQGVSTEDIQQAIRDVRESK